MDASRTSSGFIRSAHALNACTNNTAARVPRFTGSTYITSRNTEVLVVKEQSTIKPIAYPTTCLRSSTTNTVGFALFRYLSAVASNRSSDQVLSGQTSAACARPSRRSTSLSLSRARRANIRYPCKLNELFSVFSVTGQSRLLAQAKRAYPPMCCLVTCDRNTFQPVRAGRYHRRQQPLLYEARKRFSDLWQPRCGKKAQRKNIRPRLDNPADGHRRVVGARDDDVFASKPVCQHECEFCPPFRGEKRAELTEVASAHVQRYAEHILSCRRINLHLHRRCNAAPRRRLWPRQSLST